MATPPLSLSLNPSSSARSDAGDSFTSVGGFNVDFGDKNAPDGAAVSGVTKIGTELVKGVVVAVLARWAFQAMFK